MKSNRKSELRTALQFCSRAFLSIGAISAIVSVLYLTGSFFMLQVYDRVIPSHSVSTLLGLGALAAILYAFQGVLELIRSRLLVRIAEWLDVSLSDRIYRSTVQLPLKMRASDDGLQPFRDFDQLKAFLSSNGPAAFFDLPWIPIYIGICFLFHFWIGTAALAGALFLTSLAVFTDIRTRTPTAEAVRAIARRNAIAEAGRRNAEVLEAMAMTNASARLWSDANRDSRQAQRIANNVAGSLGTVSKVFRMMLQSAVLGLGGYLVIQQQASSGIIIASSILVSRALAPVELSLAHWKSFVAARQSWRRISELLSKLPEREDPISLPPPKSNLSVEALSVPAPGESKLLIRDVTFSLTGGQVLGVIGPSGSGKSTLARALVAVWQPLRGKVRLDGAALEQWPRGQLGRHIGYLPQDVELFAGSIAENICRFEQQPDSEAVLEAARAASVHEMVLRLPNGYETQIGEGGQSLSAGQRQRIALARALYRNPFLVVLDEPNSNLDQEGEAALAQAILRIKQRNGIVFVIAHRSSVLATVDSIMIMSQGQVQGVGPKEEMLRKLIKPAPAAMPTHPLSLVGARVNPS